ncbi:MAG: T9SS type A sorting domain-containing protein [bacterium]|nr:T9SS type A sorting domain-containing protein [bacterium]
MKNFVSALSLFFIASVIHSSTWTRTFDDSGSSCGTDVIVSKDSCYVVLGYTSYNSKYNVWLLKVNRNGILIWEKKFGSSYDEYGYSIDTTYDGGYIISGTIAYGGANGKGVLLIKTDDSGDTLWTRTFNLSADDRGYCVRQTIDSGYIVEGRAYTSSCGDMLLLKTDKNGNTIWTKQFARCSWYYGGGVCETPDSNYIAVGTYNNNKSGVMSLFAVSADNKGDTLWSKLIWAGGSYVYGQSIRQTVDNNYIVSVSAANYLWLFKINSNGNILWDKTIPGGNYGESSVYPTNDSGYIIVDGVNLIKTDKIGTVQWINAFLSTGNSVKETYDNGYIIAGTIYRYTPYYSTDLYLIRTDPFEALEENTYSTPDKFFSISPNPASVYTSIRYSIPNKTNISLRVFDLTGRLVKTLYSGEQIAGTHNVSLKSSELSKGIYFVTLQTNYVTKTQKLTILR